MYDLIGDQKVDQREPLKVREHPQHGPYVVGAASHIVESCSDLMTWLMIGNRERSMAATGMNDKSSRSHSVFSLKLTQSQVSHPYFTRFIMIMIIIINPQLLPQLPEEVVQIGNQFLIQCRIFVMASISRGFQRSCANL